MWYDWVVKALVSSCMSVGRPLAERLDLRCLAMGHFPSYLKECDFFQQTTFLIFVFSCSKPRSHRGWREITRMWHPFHKQDYFGGFESLTGK